MEKTDEDCLYELEALFSGQRHWMGTIESPRTTGLLEIARKGKQHWNVWRRKYPNVVADFKGRNLTDFTGIDFSGFVFHTIKDNCCVDFTGAHLGQGQKFERTLFGQMAKFDDVKFHGGASFLNAEFIGNASFCNIEINKTIGRHDGKEILLGGDIDFRGCRFHGALTFTPTYIAGIAVFGISDDKSRKPVFSGVVEFGDNAFHIGAEFREVEFRNKVTFPTSPCGHIRFTRTTFLSEADFASSQFSEIEFIDSNFLGKCSFNNAKFNGSAIFKNTLFAGEADFSGRASTTPKPTFASIRFLGCWFKKRAFFRDREFQTTALFGKSTDGGRDLKKIAKILQVRVKSHYAGKTVFLGIPDFHGCKFHQDTSFVGTEFEVPPGNDAARAFRTLKLAMEGLKSSHEEQMFFRLEMEADRPDLPRGRQWISRLYWASSNYGHSLLRPFLTLIGFMVIFGTTHGLLTNLYYVTDLSPSLSEFDSARTWQWFRYVLINTFPVPGFDKVQMDLRIGLFGQDGYLAAIATFLEMLHKVISLGCVFLLGLALRNLFKMKS